MVIIQATYHLHVFFVDEQKDMQKMKRECIWR